MITLLLFFFFQDTKPPSGATIEFYVGSIVILILTNYLNFRFNKPKSESDILKNLSDVIKSTTEALDKLQKSNDDLFGKVSRLQENDFKKSERIEELQDKLSASEKELYDCLENQKPCNECRIAINHSLSLFEEVREVFQESNSNHPLLNEIARLIENMRNLKPE